MASTIGNGLISSPSGVHGLVLVTGALVGAIAWNLFTWFFGLPSSSTHALVGGLVFSTALGRSLAPEISEG